MVHPIRKMFNDYVHLKNLNFYRSVFVTEEDFISQCYNTDQEIEAIAEQLKANGFEPVFTHVDGDGVYHYDLKQL